MPSSQNLSNVALLFVYIMLFTIRKRCKKNGARSTENENEHLKKRKGVFLALLYVDLFVSGVFCYFSGKGFK